jgi:hypothetical protein
MLLSVHLCCIFDASLSSPDLPSFLYLKTFQGSRIYVPLAI